MPSTATRTSNDSEMTSRHSCSGPWLYFIFAHLQRATSPPARPGSVGSRPGLGLARPRSLTSPRGSCQFTPAWPRPNSLASAWPPNRSRPGRRRFGSETPSGTPGAALFVLEAKTGNRQQRASPQDASGPGSRAPMWGQAGAVVSVGPRRWVFTGLRARDLRERRSVAVRATATAATDVVLVAFTCILFGIAFAFCACVASRAPRP